MTSGAAKLVPVDRGEGVPLHRRNEPLAGGRDIGRRGAADRGAEALGVAREGVAARVGGGHADRVGDDGGEAHPLLCR